MFERYTEKARRTIFFGRYEASQFGSPYIESEHLLLGLLRENKGLADTFLHSHGAVESIRKQVEGQTAIREKVATSTDLPLSNECKRILAYAAEEADKLSHKFIATGHLFLGVLREQDCFAAKLLRERGVALGTAREQIGRECILTTSTVKSLSSAFPQNICDSQKPTGGYGLQNLFHYQRMLRQFVSTSLSRKSFREAGSFTTIWRRSICAINRSVSCH